jgi:hypothetical protein
MIASAMEELPVSHLADHRTRGDEELRALRNEVRAEGGPPTPLGSRLAARFAGIGLDEEIPELRGEPARPAELEP